MCSDIHLWLHNNCPHFYMGLEDSDWHLNQNVHNMLLVWIVFSLISKSNLQSVTCIVKRLWRQDKRNNANKLSLLTFFSLSKTIYPRVLTKPLPNDAKRSLPVDVRRSNMLLLKLPNVFAQAHYWLIWRKENDLRDTIFRRRDWLWKPETSRMKTMLLRFMLDAPCRSLDRAQCLVFFPFTNDDWIN